MITDSLLNEMKKFGIGLYEAKAYITLLKYQTATRFELSKLSGVPSSRIYDVIKSLERKGMVSECDALQHIYMAQSTTDFFGSVKTEYSASLDRLQQELAKMNEINKVKYYTWSIRNYDLMISKAIDLINRSESRIYTCIWAEEEKLLDQEFRRAKKRGIDIVAVGYDLSEFKYGRFVKHYLDFSYMKDRGKQLILTNDSFGLMCSLTDEGDVQGMMTNGKELITLCREFIMHEIYWNIALNEIEAEKDAGLMDRIIRRVDEVIDDKEQK